MTRHSSKEVTQKPRGDHFVPYSWTAETSPDNLVAACQICNGIKSSRMFESVEECRRFVMAERWRRAYRVLFVPERAITADPWGWAAEYARFLIG